MEAGSSEDKPDAVLPASSGATSHLLQLRRREGLPAVGAAPVRDRYDHRARGKVDTSRDRGRRENCIQQTGAHQLFDYQLPVRQVTGVMRSDAGAYDRVPVTMLADLGMLLDKAKHELA